MEELIERPADERPWWEDCNYASSNQIVQGNLRTGQRAAIALGYYLKHIRENKLFLDGGYHSFGEYVKTECGFSESTASRHISRMEQFSEGGNTPKLADRYRDYSPSQLQEMLYLTDEQREQVTPETTVKDIREMRQPVEPEVEICDVATDEDIAEVVVVDAELPEVEVLPADDEVVQVEEQPIDEMLPTEDEPEGSCMQLKKPDDHDRVYLSAAARKLIKVFKAWMLEDFGHRVMDVTTSPRELKELLGPNGRTWNFSISDNGVCHINLFDDYVQVWNENGECLGDFEWFYLAAAIQSEWNVIALEDAKCAHNHGGVCEVQSDTDVEQPCVDGPCPYEEQDDDDDLICDSCTNASSLSGNPDLCQTCGLDGRSYEELMDGRQEEVATSQETDSDIDLLRTMLKKQNDELEEWLKVDKVEKLPRNMIRKKKIVVAALASMLCDLEDSTEEDSTPSQPDIPILKNNDQRKQWLRNYRDWGLWYEDEHIGVKYYKYDFENGAKIIVDEYESNLPGGRIHISSYMHLIGGSKDRSSYHSTYNRYPDCETELVEFLKYLQRGDK